MASVLIVGYGNTLRGDDGIGPRAAQALERLASRDISVMQCHQLGPELAEHLARVSNVILIDAAVDLPPGRIRCVDVAAAPPDAGFTHAFTPEALLELTSALFGRAPAAIQISIGGASFDLSDALSPQVEEELPRLIEFAAMMASARSETSAIRPTG